MWAATEEVALNLRSEGGAVVIQGGVGWEGMGSSSMGSTCKGPEVNSSKAYSRK